MLDPFAHGLHADVSLFWFFFFQQEMKDVFKSQCHKRNGQSAACNQRVMDAFGRFAKHKRSVRVPQGNSQVRLLSFFHAWQPPTLIHHLMVVHCMLTVMMSVRCGDSNLFIVWLTIYWYGSKSIDPSVRLHHLAANQLISLSDVTLNVLNYTLQLSIIVIQRYTDHFLNTIVFNCNLPQLKGIIAE